MDYVQRNLNDPNHWLLETIKKAGGSASGEIVNADTAMGVSAIWASIKVLSETVASLPFKLFKRDGDNKKLATDHPNFDLFKRPNSYMTGFVSIHAPAWGATVSS